MPRGPMQVAVSKDWHNDGKKEKRFKIIKGEIMIIGHGSLNQLQQPLVMWSGGGVSRHWPLTQ